MAIEQTLVGLERSFTRLAVVISKNISAVDTLDDNNGTWLELHAPSFIQNLRVYSRFQRERRILNERVGIHFIQYQKKYLDSLLGIGLSVFSVHTKAAESRLTREDL